MSLASIKFTYFIPLLASDKDIAAYRIEKSHLLSPKITEIETIAPKHCTEKGLIARHANYCGTTEEGVEVRGNQHIHESILCSMNDLVTPKTAFLQFAASFAPRAQLGLISI